MRLQAPPSIDLEDCWDEEFHLWTARPAGGRYIQGPGQIEMLWILNVHRTRLVIDAVWFPATTGEDRDELMRIVESVRIE